MNVFLALLAIAIVFVLLLPFYRVLRGPTVFDRVLATGAVGSKTITLVCLVGYLFGRIDMFLDIALGYAILNFVGVLAVAKYFGSPRIDA